MPHSAKALRMEEKTSLSCLFWQASYFCCAFKAPSFVEGVFSRLNYYGGGEMDSDSDSRKTSSVVIKNFMLKHTMNKKLGIPFLHPRWQM
ncbi:hypothetical protein BKP35_05965 [Anaerobacillus arseniciselenatis]|uniref:Uncharacterized protein n=1 Tax=Anaerobacillus arseniciselenatis TaxID=85682 RepID=A0A1S2LQ04_9BACI|nr:hypothetical protein BKP35_05965 [Anaerobacillus arseniciselenatis]